MTTEPLKDTSKRRDQFIEFALGVHSAGMVSGLGLAFLAGAAIPATMSSGQPMSLAPFSVLAAATSGIILSMASYIPLIEDASNGWVYRRQVNTPRPKARKLGQAFVGVAGLAAAGVTAYALGILPPKTAQAPQTAVSYTDAASVTAPRCAASAPTR